MKPKIFITLLFVFSLLGVISSSLFAADGDQGPASVYKVTIEKFEMYNGTSWITVSNGASTTIDIASASAGSVAGTFFAGLTVPDGSYTQVRVTNKNEFTISGNVGGRYTLSTKTNDMCDSSGSSAAEAECTVAIPGGMPAPTPDVLPETLTVNQGVPSHKIRVFFDVSTAIEEEAGQLLRPAAPTVTMEMIAL